MLPCNPDIIFPGRKVAIFVHGCFWHQHKGCRYATMPKSNHEFWEEKFRVNLARDRRNILALELVGWRAFEVWECDLKKSGPEEVALQLRQQIMTDSS